MFVAATQIPNVQIDTQSVSSHSSSDAMNLDNLVDPMSANDVSTFHSTVQQSIQQNSAVSPTANSTFSAQSVGKMVMNMVDSIQSKHKEVDALSSNIGSLSVGQTLELQESSESYSLGVQFLSKGMNLATKAIDTIVHMQ